MKIATLVSRHGLTLPQYHALAAARRQALTQTATSWRNRDGARAQTGTVRRLADQSLLAIGPVLRAREQVEATHGSAAEARAIERLGRRLADLEEHYDRLRTHVEELTKDA